MNEQSNNELTENNLKELNDNDFNSLIKSNAISDSDTTLSESDFIDSSNMHQSYSNNISNILDSNVNNEQQVNRYFYNTTASPDRDNLIYDDSPLPSNNNNNIDNEQLTTEHDRNASGISLSQPVSVSYQHLSNSPNNASVNQPLSFSNSQPLHFHQNRFPKQNLDFNNYFFMNNRTLSTPPFEPFNNDSQQSIKENVNYNVDIQQSLEPKHEIQQSNDVNYNLRNDNLLSQQSLKPKFENQYETDGNNNILNDNKELGESIEPKIESQSLFDENENFINDERKTQQSLEPKIESQRSINDEISTNDYNQLSQNSLQPEPERNRNLFENDNFINADSQFQQLSEYQAERRHSINEKFNITNVNHHNQGPQSSQQRSGSIEYLKSTGNEGEQASSLAPPLQDIIMNDVDEEIPSTQMPISHQNLSLKPSKSELPHHHQNHHQPRSPSPKPIMEQPRRNLRQRNKAQTNPYSYEMAKYQKVLMKSGWQDALVKTRNSKNEPRGRYERKAEEDEFDINDGWLEMSSEEREKVIERKKRRDERREHRKRIIESYGGELSSNDEELAALNKSYKNRTPEVNKPNNQENVSSSSKRKQIKRNILISSSSSSSVSNLKSTKIILNKFI